MYTISAISKAEYWRFLLTHSTATYQQTPEWADARRAQWEPELIGWFDQNDSICAAAVLRYRRIPGTNRSFVFIPQGPLLDWSDPQIADQLAALGAYLSSRGVFGVRITPVVTLRKWEAAAVKAGLANPEVERLLDIEPTEVNTVGFGLRRTLRAAGWREAPDEKHSDASYPRFNFWLNLTGRTEEAVLARMSKTWRNSIRKAERAGLDVAVGSGEDLSVVHRLCEETARRNDFVAHPHNYFKAMWDALGDDFPGHFNLFIAYQDGLAIAANATAQVGSWAQGVFAAKSTERTNARPSNALYWVEIRQALADGAELFDIGGVKDTLHEEDPAAGLVRFKAGLGADAYEYIGAWDLPLQPQMYAAFTRLLPLYASAAARLRSITAGLSTSRHR